MASSSEFVEYATGCLREAGDITYKKMFGEYGLYCDGKIFGLICDNMLYLKPTQSALQELCNAKLTPPYSGAKDYILIEDLENSDKLTSVIIKSCAELPEPKPKKHKLK